MDNLAADVGAGRQLMRVAVYEPDPTGHHFAYVALMVPALADLASEVILITSEAAHRSTQFALHLGKVSERFQVDTGIDQLPKSPSLRGVVSQYRTLCRAVDRIQPDHLYVPYGDSLAPVAGFGPLFGRLSSRRSEAEVLLLRGGYQYPPVTFQQQISRRVSPRLIRSGPWSRVHHLNPDDLEILRQQTGDLASRCRLMPDPVEPASPLSRLEARRKLNLPEQGRYLGCAGIIDRRKGMDLLVRAFQQARQELAPTDRLLLAGPIEPGIRQLIERELQTELREQRVLLVDRHLTVEEMGEAIAALDVVCTPYPRHQHSASIVIRAAAHERYVLGSAMGWMERTIARFGLGSTCNVLECVAFSRAIPRSLEASAEFVLPEAGRRFAKFHSSQNFSVHWAARLRERLGLSADPQTISWEWVLAALQ